MATAKVNNCVMGQLCREHCGIVHGREAETLRAGVEDLLSVEPADGTVQARDLQDLLDRVDARDSLAYLEKRRKPAPPKPRRRK